MEVGGERGGVVMEVVCLCEMGGKGNVLLLSTCIGCHGVARGSCIVSSLLQFVLS